LTAGLHRAHSCVRALTYASDAPQGPMYGFLNAYAAAALAYLRRADEATVAACLSDEAPRAVAVDARGLAWRDQLFGPAELALLRRSVGPFGSCSFDEPVADLTALGCL
jgi:hypothetical protein